MTIVHKGTPVRKPLDHRFFIAGHPEFDLAAKAWYNGFVILNRVSQVKTIVMEDLDGRYYVAALARGIQILEAFSKESPHLSLTEIAALAGMEKGTAFRFVYTLERLGYLTRDPETKRYRPGLKVMRLGFAALNSMGLRQIAQPYLKALSAQTGETANMTVREGAEVVYVARISTRQIIGINLSVGSRLPVYCTAMGKAQLIDLSRDELRDLLGEGPYPGLGPNTLTCLDALVAELDRVRRQGYAINDEELAAGLRSVAAPVRDGNGQIVAAINISVPSARVSRPELDSRLAPMVQASAAKISQALGTDSPS
jgi:IclR family transcriptional regulator, pca regulon regulatory protein